MSDYSKLTVVQIRELFKSRGIPATGLTKKAQLIERLEEHDAAKASKEESATQSDAADAVAAPEMIAATSPKQPADVGGEVGAAPEAAPAVQESDFQNVPAVAPPVADTPSAPKPTEVAPTVAEALAEMRSAAPEQAHPPNILQSKEISTEDLSTTKAEGSSSDAKDMIPSAPSSTNGEESRKRKRRSRSPVPPAEEVAIKKAKHEEKVVLKEDDNQAESKQSVVVDGTADSTGDEKVVEAAELKKFEEKASPALGSAVDTKKSNITAEEATNSSTPIPTDIQAPPSNKYKELFHPKSEPTTAALGTPQSLENDEERTVAPSLHPATRALYIRDIMRPLIPNTFRDHLTNLARPKQSTETDTDDTDTALLTFHLDAIRTHCFAIFPSISAAARVRTALHDRVWPAERDRKPLWVDFVPEEKVQDWIDQESQHTGGRGAGGPRWEVVYDVDADSGVTTATLHEAGPGMARRPTAPTVLRTASSSGGGPVEPRKASIATPILARPKTPPSFKALDSRFRSTTAKPKLYYLPVTANLADKRRNELNARYSRRPGAGGGENRRYTFEENDLLVDNGPEFGLRSGERGGRGAYRGSRGGYRGWDGPAGGRAPRGYR